MIILNENSFFFVVKWAKNRGIIKESFKKGNLLPNTYFQSYKGLNKFAFKYVFACGERGEWEWEDTEMPTTSSLERNR